LGVIGGAESESGTAFICLIFLGPVSDIPYKGLTKMEKFILLMSIWGFLGVIEDAESDYGIGFTWCAFLGHVSDTRSMVLTR
jgi:hypothetical protein